MAIVPREPGNWRHSALVRFVATVFLVFSVLTVLIVIIIWLAVQPKRLRYSVERSSIRGFNLTDDGGLNGDFHFVLRADNHNRMMSFYYDKIYATVWYEDQKLSACDVPPFYQRTRNVTHLELNLPARDVAVHGEVAKDMRTERASGDVELELQMKAKIRLKVGLLKIHRRFKVLCGPLTVRFSSGKRFEEVSCDVDIDE